MLADMLPMLLLGGGLGLVHAFDADHVMAVSALSAEKPGIKRTFFYSSHWALGHSGVLLGLGFLLLLFGFSLPDNFVYLAELAVGVLLIGLGAFLLLRMARAMYSSAVRRVTTCSRSRRVARSRRSSTRPGTAPETR